VDTIIAAACIATPVPAVSYHSYIVYKSKQGVMTIATSLV
jgi:hypothetical protein